MVMATNAFALARPATLGVNPTVRCPNVRRRPRTQQVVRCTAVGVRPSSPDPAEFASRAMSLARAALPPGVLGSTDADQVAHELRLLGATCAADMAFALLRDSGDLPPSWRDALQVLKEAGVRDEALDRAVDRLGLRTLLAMDVACAQRVLAYLTQHVACTPGRVRRAVIRAPALLFTDDRVIQRMCNLMCEHGLSIRDIRDVVARWPGVLIADPINATQMVELLAKRGLRGNLRRFLMRAPFVLLYDVEHTVHPAIDWLNWSNADVEHVIRSCPLVLGCCTSSLDAVKQFLVVDIGITDPRRAEAIIRTFPALLTASVNNTLRPALRFLRVELGLPRKEVARIVHAFPATLVLDVDAEMRGNVDYFRGRGVENVCHIVKQLPPILSYDLTKDIVPKMRFLERTLKLSSQDLMKFPAYFSYNLHDRIVPRTLFLVATGSSVSEKGLNSTLSLDDRKYCQRVARRPLKEYREFVNRLRELRKKQFERTPAVGAAPQASKLPCIVREVKGRVVRAKSDV